MIGEGRDLELWNSELSYLGGLCGESTTLNTYTDIKNFSRKVYGSDHPRLQAQSESQAKLFVGIYNDSI
jgi:hypothetical protein